MKRKRVIGLVMAVGMFTLLGTACGTGSTSNNSALTNIGKTTPPSDTGDQVVTGGDLAFMNDAGPGSMAEVELGRLAVKQAASSDVKQFAQKMIEDHSKAVDELKQLAGRKKVNLPPDVTPKHKEVMEKLSKLQRADFDREYVKEMVAAHEKDVAAFTGVSQNATDADVKAFAAKTLPTLQMHLQMIRDMAGKMGISAAP